MGSNHNRFYSFGPCTVSSRFQVQEKGPDSARWPVCSSLSVQLHALLIFPSSPQIHSLSPSSHPPLWLTLYQELLTLLPLALPHSSDQPQSHPLSGKLSSSLHHLHDLLSLVHLSIDTALSCSLWFTHLSCRSQNPILSNLSAHMASLVQGEFRMRVLCVFSSF